MKNNSIIPRLSALIPLWMKKIVFHWTGRCIPFDDETGLFCSAVQHLSQSGNSTFFIQIGANDGRSFDSLYPLVQEHRLAGLVVEPISDYFDLLTSAYSEMPNVKPVRVALHATEKQMKMYRLDPDAKDIPEFAKGIASFDISHHLRSGIPDNVMLEEIVPCLTWKELLENNEVQQVDILQVDAEGYDYEILKMVNKEEHGISIVRVEHSVGAGVMTRRELRDVYLTFCAKGYVVVIGVSDLTAIRNDVFNAMSS